MSFAMNKKELTAHAMEQAMAWLDERRIPYLSLPPYQLKIDAINFWPKTGTITIDGEPQRRPEKGLPGLESLLYADKIKPSNGTTTSMKFFFDKLP